MKTFVIVLLIAVVVLALMALLNASYSVTSPSVLPNPGQPLFQMNPTFDLVPRLFLACYLGPCQCPEC